MTLRTEAGDRPTASMRDKSRERGASRLQIALDDLAEDVLAAGVELAQEIFGNVRHQVAVFSIKLHP